MLGFGYAEGGLCWLRFFNLVMQEENGGADGRIVVAFRGTQIGKTIDCDADLCADARLWETPGREKCPPPAGMCEKFDDATLDYLSQAVQYTQKVMSSESTF